MTRPNLMLIENDYATLALVGEHGVDQELTTTKLIDGQYVRIDDGRQYPQLCVGGGRRGSTLIFDGAEDLAKACDAKLYKTREGFEAAKVRA